MAVFRFVMRLDSTLPGVLALCDSGAFCKGLERPVTSFPMDSNCHHICRCFRLVKRTALSPFHWKESQSQPPLDNNRIQTSSYFYDL